MDWLIEKEPCSRYYLNLMNSLILFNRSNGRWPIQFGMEYIEKNKLKIKIYLSVNADIFPLKSFCDDFKLKYGVLKKKFKQRSFDTVAIDLLPNGGYFFKFYPINGDNKGMLYRINKKSEFLFSKNWQRFPRGLFLKNAKMYMVGFLPFAIEEFLTENKIRVSYLCKEREVKSVYFR